MIISECQLKERTEKAYSLHAEILNLCAGYESGIVKTALTIGIATCINQTNDCWEEKIKDIALVGNILKKICNQPVLN